MIILYAYLTISALTFISLLISAVKINAILETEGIHIGEDKKTSDIGSIAQLLVTCLVPILNLITLLSVLFYFDRIVEDVCN